MSERYLSRSKRVDNGEWIEGYYSGPAGIMNTHEICDVISGHYCAEIDPNTLGQCTGLRDKSGLLIFEGDVLMWREGDYESGCHEYNAIVQWGYKDTAWIALFPDYGDCDQMCEIEVKSSVIVGNIHDNPELLEGMK